MLTRIADRSDGGGGGGSGSAAGGTVRGGSGTGDGTVEQAAICSASSKRNRRVRLVTEPDTHDVDFCCSQPTSSDIQFVKIVDGADINPKVIPIIDPCTLHT